MSVLQSKLQTAVVSWNIPQIVMSSISLALESWASDIHIEPEKEVVRIRLRIDGELSQIIEYPSNIHPAVVSRIKIMSNLKIDEQRIPQDGRTQVITDDNKEIDLRISTLPTINWEKICTRLQDKNKEIPTLKNLGIQWKTLIKIKKTLANPNGIFLVTGPTGSGKTTTLYSSLNELNKIDVNIMTIEDPVEYQMDWLNQSQVYPDIDYTFALGLRTALRQDPDIIMVGEIRDQETIEIAIRAALTGHLVLSTIHTNSATSTLTRILDMGIKPFLITSSIRTILAQRLVRKICNNCKESYVAEKKETEVLEKVFKNVDPDLIEHADISQLQGAQLYRGLWCEKCNNSGYKGRIGLYEIMNMNREIAKTVLAGKSEAEIEEIAIKNGMLLLKQDGCVKVLQGHTTLEEVFRVTKSY